jgi:hypothetical protein
MYKLSLTLALACTLVAGCRDEDNKTPLDLGTRDMATSGMDPTGGNGADMAMKTYAKSSIAGMRTGAKPGTYELDDVVVVGVSSSPSKPELYVTDPTQPDFGAMQIHCYSTGTHICSLVAMVKTLGRGTSVTLQGTYIRSGKDATLFEEFYLDNLTVGATGNALNPVTVAAADISKSVRTPAKWFQYVTLAASLQVYDLSPSEAVFVGAKACPYQLGFALIDASKSPAAAACATGNVQPPVMTTAPDASEVLIKTDFYSTFKVSSDCKCNAMYPGNTQVAPAMKTSALSGILITDSVYNSNPEVYYQYIAPVLSTDLPLQ